MLVGHYDLNSTTITTRERQEMSDKIKEITETVKHLGTFYMTEGGDDLLLETIAKILEITKEVGND